MRASLLDHPPVKSPAVAIGDTSAILSAILDPAVQLTLWQRKPPAALDWLDALDWDEIDDIDTSIDGPDWAAQIQSLLDEAGYPQSAPAQLLATELAQRAAQFAAIMRCDRLHLRLEVIETDACRKFHMDHVKVRLLMPLHGPGTQWIEAGHGSDAPVNQLGLGDVGLFKGRQWVEQPAILHRSPPVFASGETRLLFVLNPLDLRAKAPESALA